MSGDHGKSAYSLFRTGGVLRRQEDYLPRQVLRDEKSRETIPCHSCDKLFTARHKQRVHI